MCLPISSRSSLSSEKVTTLNIWFLFSLKYSPMFVLKSCGVEISLVTRAKCWEGSQFCTLSCLSATGLSSQECGTIWPEVLWRTKEHQGDTMLMKCRKPCFELSSLWPHQSRYLKLIRILILKYGMLKEVVSLIKEKTENTQIWSWIPGEILTSFRPRRYAWFKNPE